MVKDLARSHSLMGKRGLSIWVALVKQRMSLMSRRKEGSGFLASTSNVPQKTSLNILIILMILRNSSKAYQDLNSQPSVL